MEKTMIDEQPTRAGLIAGTIVAFVSHFYQFNLGYIADPVIREVVDGLVRMGFTVLSAVLAYLAVYYVKKALKHDTKTEK